MTMRRRIDPIASRALFFALFLLNACGHQTLLPPQSNEPALRETAVVAASARLPHEASDVTVDPAVHYGELANGFRYAILENDTPPNTAALRLRFDVGSLMEREEQRGLAHFLEHMAFNGSANVPEGEMVRILERHGLAFGADTNAYTSFGETVYMLDLPETDEETLDVGFMLLDALAALTLTEDAIDRERGVVLAELRGSNTPDFRAFRAESAFLYPDALLPRRLPIGTAEVLQNADAALLRDLYERYYTPERALFVAVGDFEPQEIEQRIRDTFGDWIVPDDPGPDPDRGTVGSREPAAAFFHDPSLPTVISIHAVQPAENPVDSEAQRRRSTLRDLGNAIVSRRLSTIARAPDAPFVHGSAGFGDLEETADVASLSVVAEPESWEAALAAAEHELRRALEHGFTEAELAEQTAILHASTRNAAQQADTRPSAALAGALVDSFGRDRVFSHPRDALARVEAYIDDLTTEDLEAAFAAQWKGTAPLIFMTGGEALDRPAETILAAWKRASAEPVDPPDEAPETAFAYADLGTPGEVVERDVVEDLEIVRFRFANNVMLNFKQTDFERDVVHVTIRFGGGLLEVPRERPELKFAAANHLAAGGTAAHALDELQRLMAGKVVSMGFGTGTEAFVAQSRTTPADLATQLQVWSGYLTEPAYRSEAITQFQRAYAVGYRTLSATPASVIGRDVDQILHGDDPRFGTPPAEAVQSLTADDARAFLVEPLAEAAIEIGIVGDVTETEAVAAVARTLGTLSERRATPDTFDEARRVAFPRPARDLLTLRHEGEADQAAALVYWPTPDGEDVALARKLHLLTQVLQLRVTDQVREEAGAAYSPAVSGWFSREFPGFGYIGVRLELKTEDVTSFFDVVDELAAEFAAGSIDEDGLERARRPILESIEESLEQNGYWLSLVAAAQTRPENLDRHRSLRADYEAVTLDDIKTLAGRYLDPEAALRIQVLPPDTETARERAQRYLPGG